MNYKEWLSLFGLPSNDKAVIAMLAAHGVNTPVTFPPQWSSTGVDFKSDGVSVGFTSEFNLRGGAADLPILSRVVMKLLLGKTAKNWTTYTGSLPHGLSTNHSKEDVLSLLGEPTNLSQDFCSALWSIDGNQLGIHFTDDWGKIKQLGISLPGAT